jgi:hypothetical protein
MKVIHKRKNISNQEFQYWVEFQFQELRGHFPAEMFTSSRNCECSSPPQKRAGKWQEKGGKMPEKGGGWLKEGAVQDSSLLDQISRLML